MTSREMVTINGAVVFDAEKEQNKVDLKEAAVARAKKDILKEENLLPVEISLENGNKEQYIKAHGIKLGKDGHTVEGKTTKKSSRIDEGR